MFTDLSKTVKAQLYERATSPLFGSFAIAWTGWNYKFILVLSSSMEAVEKIDYIDKKIFPTLKELLSFGFGLPLASAALFIFVYPLAAKVPFKYWQSKKAELKKIQQEIEDVTPMTQEEARELRLKLLQKDVEFDRSIAGKNEEIQQLQKLVSELQNPTTLQVAAPFTAYPQPPEPELDENQIAILDNLAHHSLHGLSFGAVIEGAGTDKITAEFNIDELQKFQYVSEFYDDEVRRLRISQQGRARLIKQRRAKPAALEKASLTSG